MEEFAKELVGRMTVAPLVLCALGILLKSTPKIPNWVIPWVLTLCGVVLGIAVSFQRGTPATQWLTSGVIQGIIAAAMSQWYYQMWKQAAIDRKKE